MEANICPNRAAVRVRFLVRKHVEQADGSVSFEAALLAEDQQRTGAADLQVMGQQESNGLADQRSSHNLSLHVTQLQSSRTELQTDMDAFTSQLCNRETGILKTFLPIQDKDHNGQILITVKAKAKS